MLQDHLGSADTGYEYGLIDAYEPLGATTIISCVFHKTEIDSSGSRLISKNNNSTGDDYCLEFLTGPDRVSARVNNTLLTISETLGTFAWHFVAQTNKPGVSRDLYSWNLTTGTFNSASSSGLTPSYTSGSVLAIGCNYDSPDRNFDGNHLYHFIWDRALSLEEITEFKDNPWQIFKPQTMYVPIT
jgi:hypothetical protein